MMEKALIQEREKVFYIATLVSGERHFVKLDKKFPLNFLNSTVWLESERRYGGKAVKVFIDPKSVISIMETD